MVLPSHFIGRERGEKTLNCVREEMKRCEIERKRDEKKYTEVPQIEDEAYCPFNSVPTKFSIYLSIARSH